MHVQLPPKLWREFPPSRIVGVAAAWTILYGETLMTVLHMWIILGIALPSVEQVENQHPLAKYLYLLSDLSLPLFATAYLASKGGFGRTPPIVLICIGAHTLLYSSFIVDTDRMAPVMDWAYSAWARRVSLDAPPAAAVILDVVCHSWGCYVMLKHNHLGGRLRLAAVSLGAAVGSCVMAALGSETW